MAKTVVALYDDLPTAKEVVADLIKSGFERERVGLVACASKEEYRRHFSEDGTYRSPQERAEAAAAADESLESRPKPALAEEAAPADSGDGGELTPTEGATTGAGIGATLGGIGGLLMGLGLLAIPGVGPAIAAGPIASALIGMSIGAVAGGLAGALTNTGVPEEEATLYAEGVRRGGSLVTAHTEDHMVNMASDIMSRHHPVDIEARVADWREMGWTGYDPKAAPLSAEEISSERQRYGCE